MTNDTSPRPRPNRTGAVLRAAGSLLAAPFLGTFAWGVANPAPGYEGVALRVLHGVFSVFMAPVLLFHRGAAGDIWPYVVGAAAVLLAFGWWVGRRR